MFFNHHRKSRYKFTGFTILELLVVVASTSMMATMVMGAVGKSRDEAKYAFIKQEFRQLHAAVYSYLERNPSGNYGEENWSVCPDSGTSVFADPEIKPIIDAIEENMINNFVIYCKTPGPQLFYPSTFVILFGWGSEDENDNTKFNGLCIDNQGYYGEGTASVLTSSEGSIAMCELVP